MRNFPFMKRFIPLFYIIILFPVFVNSFYICAPLTLATGVRHIYPRLRNLLYPRLRNLFGAKACFFTAAGSPSGGRTLTLAKKNTPYHPKIYPQSLLSLTISNSFFFIKCLSLKIRTSIYSVLQAVYANGFFEWQTFSSERAKR